MWASFIQCSHNFGRSETHFGSNFTLEEELLIQNRRTIDTKTNTRGIVSDKNNSKSSNRMDLTCLSRISLFLENNKNDSLTTLLFLLVSQPRSERTWHLIVLRNLNDTYNEKLRFIQFSIRTVGCFWPFLYVYTIN